MAKKEEPKKAGKAGKAADRPSKITRSAKPTTVLHRKAPQPNAKETNLIRRVTMRTPDVEIQDFRTGDTINCYVRVKEGEKERVQLYKGIVTKIQGSGVAKSFTVRKISAGVGVERTFPFVSPALDKVEIVNRGKVRKSRLFYLRELEGKAAKIDSELVVQESKATIAANAAAATATPAAE